MLLGTAENGEGSMVLIAACAIAEVDYVGIAANLCDLEGTSLVEPERVFDSAISYEVAGSVANVGWLASDYVDHLLASGLVVGVVVGAHEIEQVVGSFFGGEVAVRLELLEPLALSLCPDVPTHEVVVVVFDDAERLVPGIKYG